MKKLLKKLSDIKNAMRVLEIMDNCGCDIEFIEESGKWKIKPKWYVSQEEAEDLQTIILFKEHYCKRNKVWNIIFPNVKEGYRFI